MEPQQQPPAPDPSPAPADPPPLQSQPSSAPSPIPSSNISSSPIPSALNPSQNPNPNPNPNKPLTPSLSQPSFPANAQSRLVRPQWPQHQPSHLSHFTPSSSSAVAPSVQASPSTATPQSVASQRGGMAIGVPATPQSAPYSPSFGQHQFGGLGRGAVTTPESSAGPSTPQVRPQVPGYQNTVASGLGSATQMRPAAISVHQQQRPAPIRSITNPNNQPPNAQNLSGHGLLRGSSVGSPGLTSPSASQSPQLRGQPQPWLAPSQGKPPLPSHTYRGHMDPQPMQQRAHVPQQQSSPGPSQHLQASSSQQQPQSFSLHQQDQFRQAQSARPGSSLNPQLQTPRGGLGHQRPSSFGTAQPFQPGAHNSNAAVDASESSYSILSKRSIHELVNQVDPSEKLDPEVVDILVDIAEDFVDSITTFGCSLAKHRKSNTLEAKDILLHLERNWNLTIPGFGGDEIKCYRKPVINDIHRERLAAVKKSIGAEAGTARNMPRQQATKGQARAPGSAMDSWP